MARHYGLQWFGEYGEERERLRNEQSPCFRWFGWPAADEAYDVAGRSRLALYVAIAWCAPYRIHMLPLRPKIATPTLFVDLRPHVASIIKRMSKDSKYMRETVGPDALRRLSDTAPNLPPPNLALGWRVHLYTKFDEVRSFAELPGSKKFLLSGTKEAVDLKPYLPHTRYAWQCSYRACKFLNDIYLPARKTAVWCVSCGKPATAKNVRRNWTHEIGAIILVNTGPRSGWIKYWRPHAIASKHAGIRCVRMNAWGAMIRSWDGLFGSWRNA